MTSGRAETNSDKAGSAPAAPNALIGSTFAERYCIEEYLGEGSMGTVYRASHVHMRKTVALKLLRHELTTVPEIVARFEREAIAAARIAHPNIAGATDCGRLPDGSCYLVLEYVAGQNLRHALASGAFLLPRVLHIARQIAEALAAAHAQGIVHRDLKPENVMLVDRKEWQDFVKVLDFGIAKVSFDDAATITRMGMVLGTPAYMAPEQATGSAVDARADLFALGVLIYEMLCGRVPFSGADGRSVLSAQLTETPLPLPAGTPPSLTTLVMTLLAKDPNERLQTANDVLLAIDAFEAASSRPAAISEQEPHAIAERQQETLPSNSARTKLLGVGLAIALAGAALVIGWPLVGNVRTPAARLQRAPIPTGVAGLIVPTVKPAGSAAASRSDANAAGTSTSATRTNAPAKRRSTRRSAPAQQQKKRTGPGGIYIPPPHTWFD